MQKDLKGKLGMNRTGKDVAPLLSKAMLSETEELTLPSCPPGSAEAISDNRAQEVRESPEGVGSIPVPATLKGMVKSGVQAIQGHEPKALLDKLGERLAFERSGVRLYEALISKFKADESAVASIASLSRLEEIRNEEQRHFWMLAEIIQGLGADPTAVTPSADIVGVASAGLVQVLTDPRVNFVQSLEAILVAELADRDSWKILGEMVVQAGLEDVSAKFEQACLTEQSHLATLRDWIRRFALSTRKPESPESRGEVA